MRYAISNIFIVLINIYDTDTGWDDTYQAHVVEAPEDILRAITAANKGDTSTNAVRSFFFSHSDP